ncbi:MAG TPA: hypothetical protein QF861_01910 [Alphaproteobacteria bacterium]|jgi:hypothetical protein|nr:hypothetical protein [Alphaproteobacteria bacterium]|tara:strand:- start:400 stop:723 length:324 start_codon:yes stop_codon:yes gene_type:complete
MRPTHTDFTRRRVGDLFALPDRDARRKRFVPQKRIPEMWKSARKSAKSRAEEQFSATQKKDKQVLNEREKERQEKAAHVAKLRALRLAKEAADKAAAEEAKANSDPS